MKFLIACLGNIGAEYLNTRHNIGFLIADKLVGSGEGSFTTNRYAQTSNIKHRGKTLVVIKPTTYMNLSGKAVQFWMQKENIPIENILVVSDDIALPTGQLRMKMKGSAAGHNGLENIIQTLQSNEFARLRFGIGNDFPRGRQVDFVLGEWSRQEAEIIGPRIDIAADMIKSYVSVGVQLTMTAFNNK
jgi:PTH1 family peptidyl-tRNA hydrolase